MEKRGFIRITANTIAENTDIDFDLYIKSNENEYWHARILSLSF
ncbi:MAG: hypothetical protein ACUZ8E_00770 [Candidatus Anammoxibacter sp.]